MRPLEEIIRDYENLRNALKVFLSKKESNKDSCIEFQYRFVDIRADLRPWHTKMLNESETRSDKSATAIKMRIAIAMVKGEYTFEEGETPMYENKPTITNADKFAAASRQYKEFLKQRVFYKESFVNVADLREDIQLYINLLKDKLK
jgi:hypothetical protein